MEIRTEIERLEELFQEVNKAFFNNALSKPVITYNPDEKGKTLGHFVAGEIWHNRNKQNATELNIVCTFKRGKESIIETMLHECVHLFCYDNKIKDTSNRGIYHNKNFKNECIKHGLDCQKGKYGYSSTSLNEKGKEFAKNCKINLGYTHRDMLTKPSNKQKAYKYECPICHAKWRTTKELVLFCSGKKRQLARTYRSKTRRNQRRGELKNMKYEVTIKNLSNSDIKITTETKGEMLCILSSLSLYTYLGYNQLIKESRNCLSKEAKEMSDAFEKAFIKASKEF